MKINTFLSHSVPNALSRRFVVPVLFIAGLTALYSVTTYLWLAENAVPPHDDLAYHLSTALTIAQQSHGSIVDVILNALRYHSPRYTASLYPPLYYMAMALSGMAGGYSQISFILANLLFIPVLLVSLWLIGAKTGNSYTGLVAGALCMFYPFIFDSARLPLIDFPLAGMLMLNLCLLLYSEGFSHRRTTLLYGISWGLGMLLKQVFVLFAIPSLLITFYSLLYVDPKSRRMRFKNVFVAALLAAGLVALWYLPRIHFIRIYCQATAASGGAPIASWSSIQFYGAGLAQQIRPFFVVVFALAAAGWLAVQGDKKMKTFLFLSLVGIYLIFSAIGVKHVKTTIPYLPIVALISAYGIMSIPKRFVRSVVVMVVLGFGVMQWYDLSFGFHRVAPRLVSEQRFITVPMQSRLYPVWGFSYRPIIGDFKMDTMRRRMEQVAHHLPVQVTFPKHAWSGLNGIVCNEPLWSYYFIRNHADIVCQDTNPFIAGTGDHPEFLLISDPVSIGLPVKYRLLDTFVMPDNSMIYLYQQNC